MKNWRFFVPSPKKTTQSYSFKVRSFYSQSYRSCWKRSLFLPQKQENSVKLKFPLKLTIKTASWTICKKWCQQTPNNNKKHTCSTLILHLPGHNQKKRSPYHSPHSSFLAPPNYPPSTLLVTFQRGTKGGQAHLSQASLIFSQFLLRAAPPRAW